MTLGDVLGVVGVEASTLASAARPAPVPSIAYDSRSVRPGAVFVALRGQKADGASFAAAGHCARRQSPSSPNARSRRHRRSLDPGRGRATRAGAAGRSLLRQPEPADAGHRRHRHQREDHDRYLLAAVLDAAGLTAGVMGTVSYRVGRDEREASRTTPEAPDVQQLLAEMLEQRLPIGGDGGVLARPGAEARGRDALRGGASSRT